MADASVAVKIPETMPPIIITKRDKLGNASKVIFIASLIVTGSSTG